MDIDEQRQGAVTILKPRGPLGASDAQILRDRLSTLAGTNLGRLALDLSATPFVDSSGLEALADAAEQLSQSGQSLKICGANETLREVFDLTGLAPMFEHFEDTNAAVRSFL